MPKDDYGQEVEELRFRVARMPVTGEWLLKHDADNEYLMHGSKVVFFATPQAAVMAARVLTEALRG